MFKRAEPKCTMDWELASFPGLFRNSALKFAESRGKNARQRIGTRTGEEKAKSKQELRESVLHATLRDVVAVRKVDKEYGACHHDHDAERADADEDTGEQSKPTSELRQPYQKGGEERKVHESR